MLKLTKTGIGLLTKQYRSVLRKCWAINVGIFALGLAAIVMAPKIVEAGCSDLTSSSSTADIVACLNQNSVAIGYGTYALNDVSSWTVAIGGQSKAKGSSSVAIGDYAQAEKINSIAIGQWARSRGDYSVALGSESSTSEDYVISVGHSVGDLNYSSGTYSGNLYRRIVNVADGINAHDAVTLGQMNNALNYYYTKTEADTEYALLEAAIEDVDDKVEDVDDKVDAVDAKIGDLNETGIAGNDVATQLKYILENGSTGGAGVALSTLGYIGANTPYLNTTNEAMNFSSTYTIGGNMSTLANQIKTNETNISNLSSRVNLLGSYSNGSADISENYAKVIGNTSIVTNLDNLKNDGNIVKAYATPATLNNKSYTVEIEAGGNNEATISRSYRIQVNAPSQEEAVKLAKDTITNAWSDYTVVQEGVDKYINKYMYAAKGRDYPMGVNVANKDLMNEQIQASTDVTVTENNYTVFAQSYNGYLRFTVDVNASSEEDAYTKAKEIAKTGWYLISDDARSNIYHEAANDGEIFGTLSEISLWNADIDAGTLTSADTITEGSLGTSPSYALGTHTIIENIALLDSAIGDLGTTGVSGASVAAQLKLLGEVGSEALGQKIGSWSTTKDSISQTLGEETKNYGYLTAFEYDSENEQYVGTVSDNLTALDAALSLTAKGLDALSYDLYNYYYTFLVDESNEVIDSASFFQKDFSTLQKVDLQSKNPTHLGAFSKCDEVCPRPSERFVSSLSQEQMFKNNASVDAGTLSICSLQIGSVNEKLSNVFEA